ncbi:hypothetical protein EDB87DRAFT_1574945 [Lactarius vividus]|nr:hypothetical protein EDB87DRAFT_1574945 [Lactarius vividus]
MPDASVTNRSNNKQLYIRPRKLKLRVCPRDPVIEPPPKRVRIHDILPGANTEHIYVAMEAIAGVSDLQTRVVEVQEVVGAPQRSDAARLQPEPQSTDPQGREQEIEVREELERTTEVHHELEQETGTVSTHVTGPEVIRPTPTVQDPQWQGITGPALEIQAADRQEQSESADIEHEKRAIIRLTHPETSEQGSRAVEPPEPRQTDSVAVPGSDERRNVPTTQTLSAEYIEQTMCQHYEELIGVEVGKDAVAYRKSYLEQTRSAHRDRCAVELDILSPGFTLVALVEFGQVMVKTNSKCELAEQKDVHTFCNAVTDMAREICKSFFPLCVQLASGGPITNEVLARAEEFQGGRFQRLALGAMGNITAQNKAGIELVIESERKAVDAIISRQKEIAQDQDQAGQSRREDGTISTERLGLTQPKNGKRSLGPTRTRCVRPQYIAWQRLQKWKAHESCEVGCERERWTFPPHSDIRYQTPALQQYIPQAIDYEVEMEVDDQEREIIEVIDLEGENRRPAARTGSTKSGARGSLGWLQQRNVETAHRERNLPLSMALVPYRGHRRERQRIDEVANQEREVRHLKSFPTQHSDGEWRDCLLAADSGHRDDPQRLRPTMQQQERNVVKRGRERIDEDCWMVAVQQQQHIVGVANPEAEGLAVQHAQHTEQVVTNLGREMEVANRDSEVRLGTSLYQTFASIQRGQGTVDRNEDGAPAISVGGVLSMGCKKSNQERTQAQLTAESREQVYGCSNRKKVVLTKWINGQRLGNQLEDKWKRHRKRDGVNVRGRKQQATDGSAHTASDSNWRPTENTGMEIDGEVPGQEQCMGDGGGGGSGQSHSSSADVCSGLAMLTASIDRQSQLLQSLLSHTITRSEPSPSSNPRDSEPTEDTFIGSPFVVVVAKLPTELNCRAAIRKHVNELMGRKCTDAPPEPASMEAILNYKSTLDEEDGPSMEHFQADFSEKSPGCSAWNHRLRDLFVADYVKKGLPFTTVTKLSVFFMTYLETLQAANRKMAATAEQERAYKEASHRNRIAKRKKTRFDTQISALHYYKISRFIKPLREMSRAVLSDDESDHEQGTHRGQSRYSIVNEAWRSKELVVWLRTIDLLACGEKWGGRNVARQEWLNSLKRYQRDKLDVQPPMDLAFSEEEKRLAAQFIPLAKGDAHPVNQDVVDISTLENWLLHGRLENS